ncbi:hypothetical protein [Pelotomaculum propionicicum]
MDRWPCFDCMHFDTFDDHEDQDQRCKIGRAVTHMDCEFREPFTIHSCME